MPPAFRDRKEQLDRMHEIAGEADERAPLAQSLRDETEIADAFQIAQAAVDELGRFRAGRGAEAVLLDEMNVAPAPTGHVVQHACTVDAAAENEDADARRKRILVHGVPSWTQGRAAAILRVYTKTDSVARTCRARPQQGTVWG